ncbi:hypothetical protein FX988_00117 [Paraglaciecola mesophila]|uniref:2-hydroxychromene-2-carboxylate isomerase n=1 Tax=Paraglaciecola mesophila TaxID=197222 RepID=A0A857JD05_9ALTE|nr:DsbA family protein [Paraglaciecola mesophila]QHJ09909.1 hypothetical protein FX988_00117 [Paraglaciecola mesophila]
MNLSVDVYFSFRSPYSYLVTPDLLKLRDDYRVNLNLKPVLPIALRTKETLFDDPVGQKKVRYIILDAMRRAEYLGMTIAVPNPDPIVQNMATFELSEEQPFIYRLTALGVEAQRQGKGIDFAYAVSHLIWTGTPNWDQGSKLHDAIASIGLDLTQMDAAIQEYDFMLEIEQNQKQLEEAGHWGVPTMVYNLEPFFGQDRINTLRWRLDKQGLKA